MEIILESLAQRLKPLRKQKGATQKQMADYFGVTTDYLLGRDVG